MLKGAKEGKQMTDTREAESAARQSDLPNVSPFPFSFCRNARTEIERETKRTNVEKIKELMILFSWGIISGPRPPLQREMSLSAGFSQLLT